MSKRFCTSPANCLIKVSVFGDIFFEYEQTVIWQLKAVKTKEFALSLQPNEQTENINDNCGLYEKIKQSLGNDAEFIKLCQSGSIAEQRKFAIANKLSIDELADRINEAAVDILGDIILENDGEAYRVIEDYSDQL